MEVAIHNDKECVKFSTGDTDLYLRYELRALRRLQAQRKKEAGTAAQSGDIEDQIALCWSGLLWYLPDITVDDVERMFDGKPVAEFVKMRLAALTALNLGSKRAADDPNPQSATVN